MLVQHAQLPQVAGFRFWFLHRVMGISATVDERRATSARPWASEGHQTLHTRSLRLTLRLDSVHQHDRVTCKAIAKVPRRSSASQKESGLRLRLLASLTKGRRDSTSAFLTASTLLG